MSVSDRDETLVPDNASRAWEVLADRVEAFLRAWEEGGQPPRLGEFLPPQPPALRRMALVELIKVDLESRWRQPAWRKPLEEYLDEFPELQDEGDIPCDLIYEEFHVRRHAGDDVSRDDYFRRFPRQAAELERLLALEEPKATTALFTAELAEEIDAGQQVGDFDLKVKLGKGAFGSVFLAYQNEMQRLVALKIAADRGTEHQTLAQLDHPHIVRVYDTRPVPGRRLRMTYMQYVAGGTLEHVVDAVRNTAPALRRGALLLEVVDRSLSQRGQSPPADSRTRHHLARARWPEAVCWLAARLARALDYAHQRGVLHRDVKPANVLLDADGSPKLADFNISFCSKVEGATPAAYFGGSLAYMSPEQLEACHPGHPCKPEDLDGRSDVYALAVITWELLTGSRPFHDAPVAGAWVQTLDAMLAQRRAGLDAASWRQLPDDCPAGLADVLATCLTADPKGRYATAGDMARQLELCLKPQFQRLLRARPDSWLDRLRRFPLTAALAAGLAPNILLSGLNIAYNLKQIIRLLERDAPAVVPVFEACCYVVNPVLYALCMVILLRYIWPVVAAVRRRQRRQGTDDASLALARRRALRMGDAVAWVCGVAWAVSGLIFPLGIHIGTRVLGEAPGAINLRLLYLHFLTSQPISALVTATLAYFLVTLLAVRAFYPVLVQPEREDEQQIESLAALARRSWRCFFLTVAAPLAAIVAQTLMPVDPRTTFDSRLFLFLAGLGIVSFVLCYRIMGMISRDVEALAQAVAPSGDTTPSISEGGESFWTRTR